MCRRLWLSVSGFSFFCFLPIKLPLCTHYSLTVLKVLSILTTKITHTTNYCSIFLVYLPSAFHSLPPQPFAPVPGTYKAPTFHSPVPYSSLEASRPNVVVVPLPGAPLLPPPPPKLLLHFLCHPCGGHTALFVLLLMFCTASYVSSKAVEQALRVSLSRPELSAMYSRPLLSFS